MSTPAASRPDHATVERTFRALLADHGLPEPDEVAHWRDSVLFGWSDTKAIIVIDLDEVDDLASFDPTACFGAASAAAETLH